MNKDHALPFPAGRPDPYKPLVDEPIFDPAKHLALGMRLLPSDLARVATKVIALESGIEAENQAEIEIKKR
jgi:hypothetical protein